MSLRASLRLPDIGKFIAGVSVSASLVGLIQWLVGDYLRDVGGDPVDGTIEDKSTEFLNHATPRTGIALSFDGVNDNVSIDAEGIFEGVDGTNIAFETWFRTTIDSVERSLYDTNSTTRFNMKFDAADSLSLSAGGMSISSVSGVMTSYFDGNWHRIRMITIGTNVKAYVDDSLLIDATTGIQDFTSVDSGYYAANFAGGGVYAGDLCCFRFWDNITVLSEFDTLAPNVHDLRVVEGVGTLLKDYSGNSEDGTVNGATWINGLLYPIDQLVVHDFNISAGNVISMEDPSNLGFDILGASLTPKSETQLNFPHTYHDGAIAAHVSQMNHTDGVTFGFWTEFYAVVSVIVSKGDDSTAATSYAVGSSGADFIVYCAGTLLALGYAPALTGTHHHCVVVDSSGGVTWYIDGVSRKTGATDTMASNSESLYWGQDATTTRAHVFKVGDPMYYNRILTSDEADDIYNSQKSNY